MPDLDASVSLVNGSAKFDKAGTSALEIFVSRVLTTSM
jgi:hypothetical protein